jgi:hypothetical protein
LERIFENHITYKKYMCPESEQTPKKTRVSRRGYERWEEFSVKKYVAQN